MNNRLIFRTRVALNVLLLLALMLSSGNSSVMANFLCPETYCLFLPYVGSPAPVKITEFRISGTYEGYVRAVGNVMTTTADAVYNVNIEVRTFDEYNQLLATFSEPTILTTTFPTQVNPFDIVVMVDSSQVAHTEVEIVNWSLTSSINYIIPTIIMTNTVPIYDGIKVGTTIRNDTNQAITNVQGLAWALDSLYSLDLQTVTGYLAPGETFIFTDTIHGIGWPSITPVYVAVQGVTEP